MAKRKAPQNIRDMRKEGLRPKSKAAAIPRSGRAILRVGKWFVSAALGLFAVWSLIAYFLPLVSVTPSEPTSANPFTVPFIVNNDGNFAITSVQADCSVDHVRSQEGEAVNNYNMRYMQTIPRLASKDHTSVLCESLVNFPTRVFSADATLVVRYSPSFTPWIKKKSPFRFRLVNQSDGKTHWTPMGLSDPN